MLTIGIPTRFAFAQVERIRMRISVLILSLLLGLLMFIQTVIVYGLSSAVNDEVGAGASAVGIVMALGWLIAGALVLSFPLVSTVLFVLSGGLGILVSGQFPDLGIWGVVSLALAVMAFFGWRGKRRDDRAKATEQRRTGERDALLASVAANTHLAMTQRPCPSCGTPNAPGVKFCGECGTAMTVSAIA